MTKSTTGAAPWTRRVFLHRLAALSGAAAAVPAAASAGLGGTGAVASGSLRVGVIPPALRDGLGASWLDGLNLALAGAPVTLDVAEPTSHGRRAADSATALAGNGAELVVGSLTPRGAALAARALRSTPTLFLNAEIGALRRRPADLQPNLFHHSLQLWQANYAAGGWAAATLGRRAATLSSYQESGYDTTTAFVLGFEAAGGTLVDHAISGVPEQPHRPAELAAALRAQGVDFIYVNASGAQAGELLEAAGSHALPAPLARGDGAADATFAKACGDAGRRPDAFALLGYEAGLLILAAAAESRGSGDTLAAAMARAAFDGPRGAVRMDAALHGTHAEQYVDRDGAVLAWLPPVAERAALAHPDWRHAVSGWSVAYAAEINQGVRHV